MNSTSVIAKNKLLMLRRGEGVVEYNYHVKHFIFESCSLVNLVTTNYDHVSLDLILRVKI